MKTATPKKRNKAKTLREKMTPRNVIAFILFLTLVFSVIFSGQTPNMSFRPVGVSTTEE